MARETDVRIATGQLHEPYLPNDVEGVFSQVRVQDPTKHWSYEAKIDLCPGPVPKAIVICWGEKE
jgi:hypothetical protein